MGVNICHFIHHTIQTPLLGVQLRADCLYGRSQPSKDVTEIVRTGPGRILCTQNTT
jgi:hypothetical protein